MSDSLQPSPGCKPSGVDWLGDVPAHWNLRIGNRPSHVGATHASPLLDLTCRPGVAAFLRREVLPYAPDAWYVPSSVKIGYEISFTRYFYKPQPLRSLEEIRAGILALERAERQIAIGDCAELREGVSAMTADAIHEQCLSIRDIVFHPLMEHLFLKSNDDRFQIAACLDTIEDAQLAVEEVPPTRTSSNNQT